MKLMFFHIAWRNIWRNPGRSGVLMGAIFIGVTTGIFLVALVNGWVQQRFDSLIGVQTSHIQFHNTDFVDERGIADTIDEIEELTDLLSEDDRVKVFSSRMISDAMIASARGTSGIVMQGVDPESERLTTGLSDQITDGAYIDETDLRNPVFLGGRLAEKLGVEVGTRIVITFQDPEGELISAAFSVSGIYRTANSQYDERNVFVRKQDMADQLGGRELIHEVAVILNDMDRVDEAVGDWQPFRPDIEVRGWRDLSPESAMLEEYSVQMMGILLVIILLALSFGILNTMLMAIYERMPELGMLQAIGMQRHTVFRMVMSETVVLSLAGGIAGMGVGAIIVNWLSGHGLNLSRYADALADFGYDAIVYPELELSFYFSLTLFVIIAAVISGLWPAIKATRIKPIEAMRK